MIVNEIDIQRDEDYFRISKNWEYDVYSKRSYQCNHIVPIEYIEKYSSTIYLFLYLLNSSLAKFEVK